MNFANGVVSNPGKNLFLNSCKYNGVSGQWGKTSMNGYLSDPRIVNAIQREAERRTRGVGKVMINYDPFPVKGAVPANKASLKATYSAVAHIYNTVIKQELGL